MSESRQATLNMRRAEKMDMQRETWRELTEDSEPALVREIRGQLLSPEDMSTLSNLNLTVEDCLNGRYPGYHSEHVQAVFDGWNRRLGWVEFHTDPRKIGEDLPPEGEEEMFCSQCRWAGKRADLADGPVVEANPYCCPQCGNSARTAAQMQALPGQMASALAGAVVTDDEGRPFEATALGMCELLARCSRHIAAAAPNPDLMAEIELVLDDLWGPVKLGDREKGFWAERPIDWPVRKGEGS